MKANVTIHKTVYIGELCLIGEPAENKATWPETPFGVEIHEGAVLAKLVTVDAGTVRNTVIGKGCFLMAHSHVGHDSILHENVTVACGAKIGGHVEILEGCNIGLNAVIHPRKVVPPYCMLGQGAVITKGLEMLPFGVYGGNPAKFLKWNERGIEKAGLTIEQQKQIIANWNERNQEAS